MWNGGSGVVAVVLAVWYGGVTRVALFLRRGDFGAVLVLVVCPCSWRIGVGGLGRVASLAGWRPWCGGVLAKVCGKRRGNHWNDGAGSVVKPRLR